MTSRGLLADLNNRDPVAATKSRRFVALVRAINVGGSSVLKMTQLRRIFEDCGAKAVSSYIQSGNVVFSATPAQAKGLARCAERKLEARTGRRNIVFVFTRRQLEDAAAHNPFDPAGWDSDHRCHLMFLSGAPKKANRDALMELARDQYRFHVRGRVLYYAYPRNLEGRRRTIDFEKVLGVAGTSRTWQVVERLIEISAE